MFYFFGANVFLMTKLVKLNPLILEKVWGGQKLLTSHAPYFDHDIKNIGETWEVATLKEGSSFVGSTPLSSFCELSYLVKFIDTSDNLSIQVHPNDEYALIHENSKGKTETWIILDAENNAGIYLGLKDGVTKKEFKNALTSGLKVDSFLQFHKVQKNDFFCVPAGTIHAIGSGVTLCEIQQSSGITYRVWDWNRMGLDGKPRDLHIEKAMESINFNENFYKKFVKPFQKNLNALFGVNKLYTHEDFSIQYFSKLQKKDLQINFKEKESIIVLNGELSGDLNLKKYQSAIVTEAGSFEFLVTPEVEFIVVS